MKERIAIIEAIRTPFCKSGGVLKEWEADDLGAFIVNELLSRVSLHVQEIDEVIFGNVLQPSHATNIARVLAVKAGLPFQIPAYTVNRNCASGLEAIVSACLKIQAKKAKVLVVGGTESMSHFPILFPDQMRDWLQQFSKAKDLKAKLSAFLAFRPWFLNPKIPEIADPLCSLTMGQTAENLVRDFLIQREEQDLFAFESQMKTKLATQEKVFQEEIAPIPLIPSFQTFQELDVGPRENPSLEELSKLKPCFDKFTGSITAGTSSQITDGACALLLTEEAKAKALGLKPLAYITDYTAVGLDPARMGLGPAFAIAKLLKETGKTLHDFDLFEINEAFAAQVLACIKALNSSTFCEKHFSSPPLGEIPKERLNIHGGAIAIGHPLGASGARLVLTLAKALKRSGKQRGLASLCVGGGQGEAIILEAE